MTDRDFVVFYAWQSDSPARDNRNFIESALDSALKKMQGTGSIQASPRLDKDTKDIPGIPDIANTILDKIQASDVFIADITFVGKTNAAKQSGEEPIPNPNVMIELGYALSELGWERIICVINLAGGSPDNLPFDLRNRRWPIAYTINAETDKIARKQEEEKLAKNLQDAVEKIVKLPPRKKRGTTEQRLNVLEATLAKLVGNIMQNNKMEDKSSTSQKILSDNTNNVKDMKVECQKQLNTLAKRVMDGKFENVALRQGILIMSIRATNVSHPLSLFDRKNKDMLTMGLPPLYASGWDSRIYGERIVTYSKWDKIIDAATEITTDGYINAAGHEVVTVNRNYMNKEAPEDVLVIPSVAYEKSIVEAVLHYLKTLMALGSIGPWYIGIALINLKKSHLFVGARYSFDGRIFEGENIYPPIIEIDANVKMDDPQIIARALRPVFDHIWREHNYPYSLNYGETGDWVGH